MATKKKAAAPVLSERLNILDKAVLVSLRFRKLGNKAAVSTELVETDSDRDMLYLSKSLLDSDEYRAIKAHRRRWRIYLESRAMRSPLGGTSTFVLPMALLAEVDEQMGVLLTRDEMLREAFYAAYPQRVREARERLKGLFDAADYPALDRVKAAFDVRWAYLALSTPEALRSVSDTLYARERAKFAESLERAAYEVRLVLREAMADLVDRMVERLADRTDGKRKRFSPKATVKLEDFLATFHARNLTDDTALAALVEKAQALVKGVDVEALKEDDALRKRVRAGFAAIQTALAPMIEERPARRIILED